MDVDNGGSITLRELYRVLMGDAIRYVSCDFSHPDSGIVWGLDEEACVAIMDIEEGSLALNFPFLILRMRIHSINGTVIPQHDPKSLELVYEQMLRLHEDPVTLEFIEPIIVVNKFSCVLDMEIENILVSIQLPVGAVYNLNVFKRNLSKEMVRAHPGLRFVKVDFFERKRQIYFKSKRYNFRLLFLTGISVFYTWKALFWASLFALIVFVLILSKHIVLRVRCRSKQSSIVSLCAGLQR